MKKAALALLAAVFVLVSLEFQVGAQAIYKWIDEKGTVHFSDNPGSPIFKKKETKPLDENATEIAGRLSVGQRRSQEQSTDSPSGGIRLTFASGQGGGSVSSSSGGRASAPVRRG
jgi:hypothetical protein